MICRKLAFLLILAFSSPVWSLDSSAPFHVILDPGHGGVDQGVTRQGLVEKDLALRIARKTDELLRGRSNVKVVLTRRDDYALSFDERRRIANMYSPGIFVSLHFAGSSDANLMGGRIYLLRAPAFPPDVILVPIDQANAESASEAQHFATILAEEWSELFPNTLVRHMPPIMAPILGIRLPAVLLELDFLTGFDAARWLSEEMIDSASQALLSAIDRFQNAGNNLLP